MLPTFPQLPGHSNKLDLTGSTFVTKSGKQLKMRKVTMPGTGIALNVPAGVRRQNYPISHTQCNRSQWTAMIDGVEFFFKDLDDGQERSYFAACQAVYDYTGLPFDVLKTIKTTIKPERQRKNINTGVPGISIKPVDVSHSGTTGNYAVAFKTRLADGVPLAVSLNVNGTVKSSIEHALDVMMTFRTKLASAQKTVSRDDARTLYTLVRTGKIPTTKHAHRHDLVDQIAANMLMQKTLAAGGEWQNPYTGEMMTRG